MTKKRWTKTGKHYPNRRNGYLALVRKRFNNDFKLANTWLRMIGLRAYANNFEHCLTPQMQMRYFSCFYCPDTLEEFLEQLQGDID